MQKNKVEISIIIVHYKVKQVLFDCLRSIEQNKPKISFEIIVVDNDEEKTIGKDIKRKFPNVQYLENPVNNGWGGGTNLGASVAVGKYLFFLNPDTVVLPHAINQLYRFIKKNKECAVASALLLDENKKAYPLQGTEDLSPLKGIIVYSFLNKLFPQNLISNRFWLKWWNKKRIQEIDIVPLSASIVKKEVFDKADGFDENLFLYFEEYDFGRRVNSLGYKNYIIPQAQVIHFWELSAKHRSDIGSIIAKSRFYYFRKYYGFLSALMVELIVRFNKESLLLVLILTLGAFLLMLRIEELMMFIGDQGWFYLSARDMLVRGEIPLVGIASSHPWLHQGPLFIYMLAPVLWAGAFHPVSGAYLTIFLGMGSIFLIYKIGSEFFSKRVGIIAAFLYATSPLVIIYSRMPYHTSPIPFFTILFFLSVFEWTKGKKAFFPLALFFLAVLYNLEVSTAVLWFVFSAILGYGVIKKLSYTEDLFKKKIMLLSLLAIFIPLIPILLYDIAHGFPQTVLFPVWIAYRVFGFFGFFQQTLSESFAYSELFSFLYRYIQRLLFLPNGIIALFLLAVSFLSLFVNAVISLRKNKLRKPYILLSLWIIFPMFGLLLLKTKSEAYLPVFFPSIILAIALFFNLLCSNKYSSVAVYILVVIICFINGYTLVNNNYLMGNKNAYGLPLATRIDTADIIVAQSEGRRYNLMGKGEGSEFESFTMNYEYLVWFLGNGPSKEKEKLKFIISENLDSVDLKIYEK